MICRPEISKKVLHIDKIRNYLVNIQIGLYLLDLFDILNMYNIEVDKKMMF